jgi:hypothetical protein
MKSLLISGDTPWPATTHSGHPATHRIPVPGSAVTQDFTGLRAYPNVDGAIIISQQAVEIAAADLSGAVQEQAAVPDQSPTGCPGLLGREEQRAGENGADRVKLVCQGGDDAEVAAAYLRAQWSSS